MGACLVNGANRDLGRVIAVELARQGHCVPVISRSGRGRSLWGRRDPSATSAEANTCHSVAGLLARPTQPTSLL